MHEYDPATGTYQPIAPPPPSFTPKPAKSGRFWLIALGALFGIGIAGALLDKPPADPVSIATTSTSSSTTTTTEPDPTTTTVATTTTTRPVTTTTVDPAAAVADWYVEHGSVIEDILTEIETMSVAEDRYSMMVACGGLANAISSAKSVPPMPDPAVNGHWQTALTAYGNAADACMAGDIDMATVYVLDGNEAVRLASAQVEEMLS